MGPGRSDAFRRSVGGTETIIGACRRIPLNRTFNDGPSCRSPHCFILPYLLFCCVVCVLYLGQSTAAVVVVDASICSVNVSEAIGPVQGKFSSSGSLLDNTTGGIVRVHPNARDSFRGSLMFTR